MTNLSLEPIVGFDDKIGPLLRQKRFVERRAAEILEGYGYEEFDPPIVERAETYGAIVGIDPTPWTEGVDPIETPWDKTLMREFFPLNIRNFAGESNINSTGALLLPEGTASYARYVAKCLSSGSEPYRKVYYIIKCFRNEDVRKLSDVKRRAFGQIGVENLSNFTPQLEGSVYSIPGVILDNLGIPTAYVKTRVNDVRIFRNLCKESELDTRQSVKMKILLDGYARYMLEGKGKDKKDETMAEMYGICPEKYSFWSDFFDGCLDASSQYYKELAESTGVLDVMANISPQYNPKFDPFMIRGWEYYTGPIMQIDVMGPGRGFIEIAGGGRYDKMVNSFLSKCGIKSEAPATGFAFGTERLVEAVATYSML